MDFGVFAADLFKRLGGALPGGLGRGDVGLDLRKLAVDPGEIDPAAAHNIIRSGGGLFAQGGGEQAARSAC